MATTAPRADDATLAFLTTEVARRMCDGLRLRPAHTLLSEAAYHLSDRYDPDERAAMIAAAQRQIDGGAGLCGDRAEVALQLTDDAVAATDALLHGPLACGEVRLARHALLGAMDHLVRCVGVPRAIVLLRGDAA